MLHFKNQVWCLSVKLHPTPVSGQPASTTPVSGAVAGRCMNDLLATPGVLPFLQCKQTVFYAFSLKSQM
jgi:hypothetical protein